MDEILHKFGYMGSKYLLLPLVLAGASALWIYLKNQKDKFFKNFETQRQERIKNNYRKELDEKELIERLKEEVHKERGYSE